MSDKATHARGWLRKAESDIADASRTLGSDGPFDTACFHAQQAAEKLLKGFLALRGHLIPRTHDLEELQRMCLAVEPELGIAAFDLSELTSYAVEMRYDFEFWPDDETARGAVELVRRLRGTIIAAVPEEARP